MKVSILKPYGYCFGVLEGLKALKEIKSNNFSKKIYILGNFVHNKFTNDELIKDGFMIFKSLFLDDQINLINSLDPKNDVVVFALHGFYKQVEDLLKQKNITYFDISCKFVRKNIEIVKNHPNINYFIIGNDQHVEIKYLTSFLNIDKYIVNDFNKIDSNIEYTLLNQTTLNESDYDLFKDKLKDKNNILFDNKNICKAPAIRYQKFKENIVKNSYDYVFIIGSKSSQNTNNLLDIYYKTTKYNNIGIFNDLDEIKRLDLTKLKKVLVLSGTSTNNCVVEDVINYLKSI